MNGLELVSIVIVTYNSEKFIEQTLDSCLKQTYRNIEVIISDDNSEDNTLQICTEWKEKNNCEFELKIVTSNMRAGIPANCNRGAKASAGSWLKFLGADDILVSDAIEKLMLSRKEHTGIIFSRFETFGDKIQFADIYPYSFTWNIIKERSCSVDDFSHWRFLLGFSNVAPGVMISRETFYQNGTYDERYYLLEDLPLWYKVLSSTASVSFCESITVKYRIHAHQATAAGISKILKSDLLLFNRSVRKKFAIPYYHNLLQILANSNKKYTFLKYIDIFQWYISIYNRMFR
ncbi:TPA: glycosyltransferase family 2 protein [Citrobacter freundii]|nr:glycosyltransferase family 2 protein [Citrobacter freundii]